MACPSAGAQVTGEIVEQGREKKILVFHYKRKKQYKKLRGHRQDYTAVRIVEIAFDGQKFKAPELAKKAAEGEEGGSGGNCGSEDGRTRRRRRRRRQEAGGKEGRAEEKEVNAELRSAGR